MAELIGGFCTSHAPGQVTRLDAGGEPGDRFLAALGAAVGRVLTMKPDVLIICAGEHFTNFPPNALPQVAIGTGELHLGPSEPWMKIPPRMIPGAPELSSHLANALLHSGFDPTCSRDLSLDHGVMTSYLALDPEMTTPVIPIIQNTLMAPMMPLARCYELGLGIANAVEAFPGDLRVAIIGTGGLSHWIGTAKDGEIDEEFDRWILERFATGDIGAILDIRDSELDHAGTGAHEIRSWLVAAGALRRAKATVLGYEPVPAWITGMAVLDLTI